MENADIIDLYQVIENRFDLYQPDGVHLCEEGYELLAEECAGKYRNTLIRISDTAPANIPSGF